MTARKRKRSHFPSLLPDVLNPVHQLRVMNRLIRRSVERPGSAPGTLLPPIAPPEVEVRATILEYSPDHCREEELRMADSEIALAPAPAVNWINVDGLHDLDLIRRIGERFTLHPLVLEDIVNVGQRPKLEEHQDYVFIVLPMLSLDAATGTVRDEQVSIVLGADYVLTFQERPGDDFDPVRQRIRSPGARIRQMGGDYLAYALIDAVIDHYFAVLEAIADAAEHVEAEVVERPSVETMHQLHAMKREMLVVRRSVWPVRDLVNGLTRSENPLIRPAVHVYLRDVYDHAVRIVDTAEVLRDVIAGVMDLYLSSLSQRTNEIMKTLTVIASIFIPLTFIAGVYGMNFLYMPELGWPWAYPTLLVIMAAIALLMLWYFRRKEWM